MLEHIWTVLCSKSLVDQETQNITLFEVLEQVNVPKEFFSSKKEVVLPNFEVVSLWGRANVDKAIKGKARLTLQTPSGKSLNQHEYAIDLSTHQRTRTRAKVNSLIVNEPGRYQFSIERFENQRWKVVGRVPLLIQVEK